MPKYKSIKHGDIIWESKEFQNEIIITPVTIVSITTDKKGIYTFKYMSRKGDYNVWTRNTGKHNNISFYLTKNDAILSACDTGKKFRIIN